MDAPPFGYRWDRRARQDASWLRRHLTGAALYHAPNLFCPPMLPCRTVISVMDLFPWRRLRVSPWRTHLRSKAHYLFTFWALRRADAVIAISEATRRQIKESLPGVERKTKVIHLASRFPRSSSIRSHSASAPYRILLIGGAEPQKNADRALNALAQAYRSVPLLIRWIGAAPRNLDLQLKNLGLSDVLEQPGFISAEHLENLYSTWADLLLFPSLDEGFGLPILEAMQMGVPVAASDIAVFREIGADAFEPFDPCSISSMAEAILRILSDPERWNQLHDKGLVQASRFSWRNTAAQTCDVFAEALRRPLS